VLVVVIVIGLECW